MRRGASQDREHGHLRALPASRWDAEEIAAEIRELLPWRSVTDGSPVAMDIASAGVTTAVERGRPIGTPFAVVVADNWDAADAIQSALLSIGGLDSAEWTAGWTRSSRGFREIKIFPQLNPAA